MGEARNGGLRVRFDGKVKLEFHGARVSSDGGLLAYRELDEALGLTAMLAGKKFGRCHGKTTPCIDCSTVRLGAALAPTS